MKKIVFLWMCLGSIANAEDLSLQQRANFAFGQMKEAERDVTKITQQIEVKKGRLQYFKEKVTETEQELEDAYKESQAINKRLEVARKRWEDLANQLTEGARDVRD